MEDISIHHTYDDFLIADAEEKQTFTQDNFNRLLLLLKAAELTRPDLIAVTCSTLTPALEKIRPVIGVPLVAIDDLMMKKAVQIGRKITLLVTARTTLAPSVQKLFLEAERIGRKIELTQIVCPEALRLLKSGDGASHDALVKKAAQSVQSADVLVLAQASLAHLGPGLEALCGCPVLSSPKLCVEQIKSILFGG